MDFTARSFQVIQRSANAGTTVDAIFNIGNLTNNLVENVEVEFFLSSNDWISRADYSLGDLSLGLIQEFGESGLRKATFTLPPESDPFWNLEQDGNYYIGVLVKNNPEDHLSSYQQFIEYDALNISVSNIVDLKGESFSVANFKTDSQGNIVADINFGILNQGDGDAGTFTVDFFLSDNEHISTDDIFIGSYEVGGLANNSGTGFLGTSLALPNAYDSFWSDGAGYYSLGMIINRSGAVDETHNFANNSNQGEGIDYSVNTINNSAWVNLQGIDFNVLEEDINLSYQPGKTIHSQFGIVNDGLAGINTGFTVNFYISTDNNITTDDTFIRSYRFENGLAAKAFYRENLALTLPDADNPLWGIDTDRYFVGMVIDVDNEVAETNETDNGNTKELIDYDGTGGFLDNLRASTPDLLTRNLKITSGPTNAGATIDLEFLIANFSRGNAAPFNISFYISDNEYISTNDVKLGTYELANGLSALTSTDQISTSFNLPDPNSNFWRYQGDGTYYIGAIVDPENAITEFDESNNKNTGYRFDSDVVAITNSSFVDLVGNSFAVVPQPTLIPGELENSFEPGQSVTVEYSIANQKQGSAGTFNVDFYISDNPYISKNDVKIGSQEIAGLNGKSTTELLNGVFQLPGIENEIWSKFDGTYYVGMLIDSDDRVPETTQLNNNNQGQFIDSDTVDVVGLNPNTGADLLGVRFNVVPEASEANPLIAGEDFDVKYEVFNQGGDDVKFSASSFYLFTEEYLNTHDEIAVDDVDNVNLYSLLLDQDSALIVLEPYEGTGIQDINLRIPSGVTPGKYYVGMLSDRQQEVTELNEGNNSLTAPFIDYEPVYIDV